MEHRRAQKPPRTDKKVSTPRRLTHAGGTRSKSKSDTPEDHWITHKELAPGATYFPRVAFAPAMRAAKREDILVTLRLGYDQSCTADGSGNLATVFSDSPAGAQNWTSYAATFEQYRVLAFRVEFDPFWTVNTTFAPIASVIDRSDATALTSYGLAERYGSHHKAQGKERFSQLVTMSSIDTSDFIPTSTITASAWIKMFSSGNTASASLGRYNVELLVQFRGLGIN